MSGVTAVRRLTPRERIGAWSRLVRAPLLLSPWADIAAGASLASLAGPIEARPVIAAGVTASCFYAAGMIQNALVDIDEDRLHTPQRPLPSGVISTHDARRMMRTLFAVGFLAALVCGWRALAIVVALFAGITAYHRGLKRTEWLGSMTLGGIRGLDLLLGAVATGVLDAAYLFPVVYACFLYAIYVTGASIVASMEDGPRRPFKLSLGLVFCALALFEMALGYPEAPAASSDTRPAFGLAIGFAILATLRWPRKNRPLRPFAGFLLTGFFVFDALVALAAGQTGVALALLVVFFVSRELARRFPPS